MSTVEDPTVDRPSLSDARAMAHKETVDPELQALPGPPRRLRTVAVVLMLLTTVAACAMCWMLRSEVSYATSRSRPAPLGNLASLDLSAGEPNQYVEARGVLEPEGAILYSRPLEGDSFRLQRIAGSSQVWVEIRVPEGMEDTRFIPPVSFTGRLVPFSQSGLRHTGITNSVSDQTGQTIASDAWLLVDGASPRASRWALALVLLFGCFALWNTVNVVRVLRPIS